ncbi:hypothetical protein QN362_00570 [Actimicrobium sp. CCC2.4]|uniref:hypothetical protein n=1 Tax=Actimicrobium sp. CCC2.4 TaxID=3048606 RepID=UPI002AC9CA0E|nr:hypothetical protein [Actimicrobium sp. CCC2.4]MEB0133818.1 hypothetical protein [Actimicrobium sp. CCC2.4]WPX31360.1 hypothetical protein RHM62_14050 [Actimicrobium sp. CCC2.4]
MSRSGYTDECDDNWGLIRWRGAVNSSIKGKRGQAMLREIAAAMDAMPDKELVTNNLQVDGSFCTLGVVGAARGIDMSKVDSEDREAVAKMFGISEALAAEIMHENDESYDDSKFVEVEICGPVRPFWPYFGKHKSFVRVPDQHAAEKRWRYMREWVRNHIATGGQQ